MILSYLNIIKECERQRLVKRFKRDCSIYLSVVTFEERVDIGQTVVEEIENAVRFFEDLVGGAFGFIATGERIRERIYAYPKDWEKVRGKLLEGTVDHLSLFRDRTDVPADLSEELVRLRVANKDAITMNGHRLIDNFGKYIDFSVKREGISDEQAKAVQEFFLASGMRMMTAMSCVDGVINCEPHDTDTAHEEHMGIVSARESSKLVDHIRSYAWANFLTPAHVAILGGMETVLANAPVYRAEPIENGGICLQLTESIDDYNDDVLRELKRFLRPLLLERVKEVDLLRVGAYRMVLDEQD